jgi:F-type H+-transporting ATPase subunit delta
MSAVPFPDQIEHFATAVLEIAHAEGDAERITEELYRVAQAIDANPELRDTLADPRVPMERRHAVVAEVLEGRAADTTISLVSFLIMLGRSNEMSEIAVRALELAAAREEEVLAEVRSAVELEAGTVERLTATLAEATGRRVRVSVTVDPSLIGGIVAKVGDTVFDGSVLSRLKELREVWG